VDCIFCKIVSGEVPSYKIWEDEFHIAFLDIFPIKEGHTLVIPKKHFMYMFDLEDDIVAELMKASKKVAEVLKKAFNPKTEKVGAIVYGLDVDHTHIHLVPIDNPGDLSFANKKAATQQELQDSYNKIKALINKT
jgi:histidine triad (HIT) family protein